MKPLGFVRRQASYIHETSLDAKFAGKAPLSDIAKHKQNARARMRKQRHNQQLTWVNCKVTWAYEKSQGFFYRLGPAQTPRPENSQMRSLKSCIDKFNLDSVVAKYKQLCQHLEFFRAG